MGCDPITLPDGTRGLVCNRGRRRARRCWVQGCEKPATQLCDFPVERRGRSGTCDRDLCRDHAHADGPDRDHCPPHHELAEAAKARALAAASRSS